MSNQGASCALCIFTAGGGGVHEPACAGGGVTYLSLEKRHRGFAWRWFRSLLLLVAFADCWFRCCACCDLCFQLEELRLEASILLEQLCCDDVTGWA